MPFTPQTLFYPMLVECGSLIIDNDGHWPGKHVATDQYINEYGLGLLLNRIDYDNFVVIQHVPIVLLMRRLDTR